MPRSPRSCWASGKALEELRIESLLALPLTEGNDQIGVMILAQNTTRTWQSSEVVVLKTLSDQVVIALNNAGLRRLVKNLSVTDEKSGLLKRASYLDLLQAETRRGLQGGTAVTVLLMNFGRRSLLVKEYGEAAVDSTIEQIGQLFSANIRTNDLGFRYQSTTIALILGDTGEKEAMLAVEKLRRLLADVRFNPQEQAGGFQRRTGAGRHAATLRPGGYRDGSGESCGPGAGEGRRAGNRKNRQHGAAVRGVGGDGVSSFFQASPKNLQLQRTQSTQRDSLSGSPRPRGSVAAALPLMMFLSYC